MEGKLLADRYLLQQQIGNQVGRKTFLALDQLAPDITHNSVVIKLLSLGNNFSWQHLKLFAREADTLKQLNHPAIPRYLDYLEIDEPNFKGFALVQTYIEAENLEQHLKAGQTFSETEVTQIARALLDTLIYLQTQNPAIVHRDIKPSNIVLANRSSHQAGNVYLVDFGFVQHLADQEGGTITVVGTCGYMPPEQFGGRTTPATDLYGLGATLIYLATDRHPTELLQENLHIQFSSFANLSPAFSDWLSWLTEPSLEQRLVTAAAALEALNSQEIRQSITPPNQVSELGNNVTLKPQHTDIICRKNTEYIEFIIPTPVLGFALLGVVSFIMPLILYFSGGHLFGRVRAVTLCLLVMLYPIFICFGNIKLRIDRSRISLKKELWGFQKNILPPSSIKTIQSIHKFPTACGKDAAGNIVWRASKLEIITGSRKYSLRSMHKVSLREIDWIAAEISDWLDLPIESGWQDLSIREKYGNPGTDPV